jgi:hypothetical protein
MGDTGDFWLAKIDALGQTQWSRTYPREGADYAYALTKTKDGGYALAGVANYTAWEDIGGPGRYSYTGDVCLIKTDAAGIAQWNQIFNLSSGIDLARGFVATQDGGYALAGSSGFTQGVGGKLLLMKTNEYGVVPENWTLLEVSILFAAVVPFMIFKRRLQHARKLRILLLSLTLAVLFGVAMAPLTSASARAKQKYEDLITEMTDKLKNLDKVLEQMESEVKDSEKTS